MEERLDILDCHLSTLKNISLYARGASEAVESISVKGAFKTVHNQIEDLLNDIYTDVFGKKDISNG